MKGRQVRFEDHEDERGDRKQQSDRAPEIPTTREFFILFRISGMRRDGDTALDARERDEGNTREDEGPESPQQPAGCEDRDLPDDGSAKAAGQQDDDAGYRENLVGGDDRVHRARHDRHAARAIGVALPEDADRDVAEKEHHAGEMYELQEQVERGSASRNAQGVQLRLQLADSSVRLVG